MDNNQLLASVPEHSFGIWLLRLLYRWYILLCYQGILLAEK